MVPLLIPVITVPVKVMATMNPSKSNWTRYGDVDKIIFVVTIHDAQARRQSFGQVSGAFIRLVNDDNQTEVARYDLTEDASTETAMLFGELYRHNGEWKFRAVGGLCWWTGFRVRSVRHQRVLIKVTFLPKSFGVMPRYPRPDIYD